MILNNPKHFRPFWLVLLLLISSCGKTSHLQARSDANPYTSLNLHNLDEFESASPDWTIAGEVFMDFYTPLAVRSESGTGILVNGNGAENPRDIYTSWEHGDLDLDLEFMMANGSNSGIYFQGRYELQLLDSWGVQNPGFADLGGIYEDHNLGGGVPPRVNAARAPGLWQHLSVKFRAPRFNDQGEKIAHARFEEVILNGVMIHEQVDLIHTTGGAISTEEAKTGPLRIQGDHGPAAFRNIQYRSYDEPLPSETDLPERYQNVPNIVNPADGPKVFHGFMEVGDRVLPHSAAVGYPGGISYALDLNSGGLLKVWKGDFLNVATMWHGRGGGNLSVGKSAITLSASPSLAWLDGDHTAWPDSLQDGVSYTFNHFRYDDDGKVLFSYHMNQLQIEDRIIPENENKELSRNLTFQSDNPVENLYVRIANGDTISQIPNGLYQVDDYTFYIRLDDQAKRQVRIRDTDTGQELLIPVAAEQESSLTYSLIW